MEQLKPYEKKWFRSVILKCENGATKVVNKDNCNKWYKFNPRNLLKDDINNYWI